MAPPVELAIFMLTHGPLRAAPPPLATCQMPSPAPITTTPAATAHPARRSERARGALVLAVVGRHGGSLGPPPGRPSANGGGAPGGAATVGGEEGGDEAHLLRQGPRHLRDRRGRACSSSPPTGCRLSTWSWPSPIPGKGRVLTALTAFWAAELSEGRPLAPDRGGRTRRRGHRRGRGRPRLRRGPLDAGATGRDAAHRVHRPRLPLRLGLGRVQAIGDHARRKRCRRGCSSPNSCLSRSSPLRPRPPWATTRTSPSTRPPIWWVTNWPPRPGNLPRGLPRRSRPGSRADGIIIADTKFELGLIDGELAICDEVLTPDSSRFWPADAMAAGRRPAVVRQAAAAGLAGGDRLGQATSAPGSPGRCGRGDPQRYVEAYERLSGLSFADWPGDRRLTPAGGRSADGKF